MDSFWKWTKLLRFLSNHVILLLSSVEQHGDFLTLFESSSGGRKKLASLSKVSPEKKTTWNILVRARS